MSLVGLFTERMDVYAGQYSSVNSAGPQRTETSAKATSQPCRVEDVSSDQQVLNAALGIRLTHRIFTQYSGVVNGDAIEVSTVRYRAVGISKRRAIGGMAAFYVIDAEEVRA